MKANSWMAQLRFEAQGGCSHTNLASWIFSVDMLHHSLDLESGCHTLWRFFKFIGSFRAHRWIHSAFLAPSLGNEKNDCVGEFFLLTKQPATAQCTMTKIKSPTSLKYHD